MQYLDSALVYLSFLIADMVVESDHPLILNEHHVDIVPEDVVVDDSGKMMSFYI